MKLVLAKMRELLERRGEEPLHIAVKRSAVSYTRKENQGTDGAANGKWRIHEDNVHKSR